MRIYLDESGSFFCVPDESSSVSCVAALVISNNLYYRMVVEFEAWKKILFQKVKLIKMAKPKAQV
ncbi:membrane protein [Coxiella burnetii]|uniref:membrane protein n=1 Tax=Coxiella burnetii TaxID=777 RepID=UPI00051F1AE0|nr:membrane protein [Coxiella burnetii]AIT63104.1 putative membrane associated protein [Coxiella burnetii str. Namibia]